MADNRGVCGHPTNPQQMQTGQAKEGSRNHTSGDGNSPWTLMSTTYLGKTIDGSFGLLLLLLYGEEYAWWVRDKGILRVP